MIQPPQDPQRKQKLEAFNRLLSIIDELRLNCPWDKKQTMETLRHLTIEETYELSDAILNANMEEIKKEIGDLMLHLVFYSKIAEEKGVFNIAAALHAICDKLVHRHPHVYADAEVRDEEVVKANWEKIKLNEKGTQSVLGGVPKSLPAMVKAIRIQDKARGVGFDWEQKTHVWKKVEEEIQEFKKALSTWENEEIERKKVLEEFGDLLFSLANYARFIDIDPEEALERTNLKFIRRFQYLESESLKEGKNIAEMSIEEMNYYWEQAKSLE